MQWAKGRRRYRSPPLMDLDGGMKVETKDKAEALRKALLPPPAPADLPQIDLHLPHDKTVAEEPFAAPEVETALFEQDPNKAAGPDGVSFLTLRRLWPVAKDSIVTLLGTGLKLGWHPRVFRQATLVVLKKAGNRDPAQPRSYRLVSLLPCLGKVLEKIVARRLSFYVQKYGWIPPEQFGGMPGRTTNDEVQTTPRSLWFMMWRRGGRKESNEPHRPWHSMSKALSMRLMVDAWFTSSTRLDFPYIWYGGLNSS
ncbi:hypothetical protein CF319_g5944 [Tilletia indica]|nr:hypothetical protein CF319_g5944 [Tilletia indica]